MTDSAVTPGQGQGEPDGTTPPVPPVSNEGMTPATPAAGGDEQKVETFDRAYVEALRQEAAGYRTRAKQAEETAQKAQSETAARIKAAEDNAAAMKTKVQELTVQQAVYLEAVRMGFFDPEDAVRLSDSSVVKLGEDGKVEGVTDALQALAKTKPHLLRARGTGDAAHMGGAATGNDMNRQIRQRAGHTG